MIDTNSRLDWLSRLLDVASIRHRVIAQNVANVNTPEYQQQEVSFEDTFGRALGKADFAAALKIQPRIVNGPGGAMRADGNNVDIDLEMANLAKNTLLFQTLAQVAGFQVGTMRSAIRGS